MPSPTPITDTTVTQAPRSIPYGALLRWPILHRTRDAKIHRTLRSRVPDRAAGASPACRRANDRLHDEANDAGHSPRYSPCHIHDEAATSSDCSGNSRSRSESTANGRSISISSLVVGEKCECFDQFRLGSGGQKIRYLPPARQNQSVREPPTQKKKGPIAMGLLFFSSRLEHDIRTYTFGLILTLHGRISIAFIGSIQDPKPNF